ncbi:MAG TPA: hypothetical protein VMV47_12110 [Bacteroidales bacterium]|nr:hypothetical protein [Bacteroidales bacterium]
MENKLLHKKILISFFVMLILSLILLFTGLKLVINLEIEAVIAVPGVLLIFSILLIISSVAIRNNDVIWLRKCAKYSVYFLPIFAVGLMIYIYFDFDETTLLFWLLVIIVSILTIFAMLHLFIYSDSSFTSMVVFILILVVGIYFKRNRWPFSAAIISNASFFISIGSFMFGVKCLFIAGRVTYFRNTAFFGSIIISLAYLGQLFKIQHWPLGGFFTIAGFGGLIFGTLYVLATLHTSGYVDWDSFYKKKIRQIIIPWAFIFVMYISRYLVPELNTLIWTPDDTRKKLSNYGFTMKDYSIEEKNGIKNE